MHFTKTSRRPERTRRFIDRVTKSPESFLRQVRNRGIDDVRCFELIKYCDDLVVRDLRRARIMVKYALEVVNHTDNKCLNVRALTSAAAIKGDLAEEGADRDFEHALSLAYECERCLAETYYRRARFFIFRNNPLAFSDIEQAHAIYERLDDSHGVGKSCFLWGLAYWQIQKCAKRALELSQEALVGLDLGSEYRVSTYIWMTEYLANGGLNDALQGLTMVRDIRASLRGHKAALERALLNWTEGLLQHRIGFGGRALVLLNRARNFYLKKGFPTEVAMITADLAHLNLDSIDRIKRDLSELHKSSSLVYPTEIGMALQSLWTSVKEGTVPAITRAIKALRSIESGNVLHPLVDLSPVPASSNNTL